MTAWLIGAVYLVGCVAAIYPVYDRMSGGTDERWERLASGTLAACFVAMWPWWVLAAVVAVPVYGLFRVSRLLWTYVGGGRNGGR